jgi:hypothetical protein
VAKRSARLNELRKIIAPLKADRLKHHEIIHRLKFEEIIAENSDMAWVAREKAEAELSRELFYGCLCELRERIHAELRLEPSTNVCDRLVADM